MNRLNWEKLRKISEGKKLKSDLKYHRTCKGAFNGTIFIVNSVQNFLAEFLKDT